MRAVSRECLPDALNVVERPAPVEPGEVERLLVDLYLSRPVPDPDKQVLRRVRFAELEIWRRGRLAERAAQGIGSLRNLELRSVA